MGLNMKRVVNISENIKIERYLSEDNLQTNHVLNTYERDNNGWIPLKQLKHFLKLSSYTYETILNAVNSKQSNIIELNLCEPISIRRRRQMLVQSFHKNDPYFYQTVIVYGLPETVKNNELYEFFNRFYPIRKIQISQLSSTINDNINSKVYVIFEKCRDALEFVRKSKLTPIIYFNEYVRQLNNGYTLVCKMLSDCYENDNRDSNIKIDHSIYRHKLTTSNQSNIFSRRVSFNTNISTTIEKHVPSKLLTNLAQTKSCLKSSTCATEQILFCQNTNDRTSLNIDEYKNKSIVIKNCFSYEFYVPNHLIKQTCQCIIVAALNPHCFTIQFKQDALEFDKFQRKINEFYNEINDEKYLLFSNDIKINLCVVCADRKTEKIWNRSQILDYDPTDNTVNLFHVDLGTWEEYVPINNLRYLTKYFHRHLVFSVTCRLAHISPLNMNRNDLKWSTDATDQFLAVIDQALPDIELLSFEKDGSFQTNLFIVKAGEYVCVNDYMIHIRKAQATIDNTYHNMFVEDNQMIKNPPIHPVIALYSRLGEDLKKSLIKSSIIKNPLVKFLPISIQTNNNNKQINKESDLIIVFIHYQKTIFIPDFNIYSLLKMIKIDIDINAIENYALTIRSNCVRIMRECNYDIFQQIDLLIHIQSFDHCLLFTIDVVRSILEYYNYPIKNVFLALENAKYAEKYSLNLSHWFTIENQLISMFDNSLKLNNSLIDSEQNLTIKQRLPFSNRLISST